MLVDWLPQPLSEPLECRFQLCRVGARRVARLRNSKAVPGFTARALSFDRPVLGGRNLDRLPIPASRTAHPLLGESLTHEPPSASRTNKLSGGRPLQRLVRPGAATRAGSG